MQGIYPVIPPPRLGRRGPHFRRLENCLRLREPRKILADPIPGVTSPARQVSWCKAMESPSTDAQLIAAALSGRLSAFEALVVRHQDRLYLQALSYLRAEEEAQDALQDAFLKAFRQLETLKEPSRFPAWVGRILRNVCLNRLREDRRRRAMAESAAGADGYRRASGAGGNPPGSVSGAVFKAPREKRPGVCTALPGGPFDPGRGSSDGNNPCRGETAAVQGAQTASGGGHPHGKRRRQQAGSARGVRSADHCPPVGTGQEGSAVHEMNDARARFREALEVCPDHPEALMELGRTYDPIEGPSREEAATLQRAARLPRNR